MQNALKSSTFLLVHLIEGVKNPFGKLQFKSFKDIGKPTDKDLGHIFV